MRGFFAAHCRSVTSGCHALSRDRLHALLNPSMDMDEQAPPAPVRGAARTRHARKLQRQHAAGREARERMRAEAERDRLFALERETRAAVETASKSKDGFLALLGHELRNPLAATSNAAQRLADHRAPPESAPTIGSAKTSASI